MFDDGDHHIYSTNGQCAVHPLDLLVFREEKPSGIGRQGRAFPVPTVLVETAFLHCARNSADGQRPGLYAVVQVHSVYLVYCLSHQSVSSTGHALSVRDKTSLFQPVR